MQKKKYDVSKGRSVKIISNILSLKRMMAGQEQSCLYKNETKNQNKEFLKLFVALPKPKFI